MQNKTNNTLSRNLYIVMITCLGVLSCLLFALFFLVGKDSGPLSDLFKPKEKPVSQTDPVKEIPQLEDADLLSELAKARSMFDSAYLVTLTEDGDLPEGFVVPEQNSDGTNSLSLNPTMWLELNAKIQFERFLNDAAAAGFDKCMVLSAFKTVSRITETYNELLQENLTAGQTREEAEANANRNGLTSKEFATGLLIALTESKSMTASEFMATDFYQYIRDNIHKYGFVQRFPADKKAITGFEENPFIYRYVGSVESAAYMFDNKLTLEEYGDYLKTRIAYLEQKIAAKQS